MSINKVEQDSHFRQLALDASKSFIVQAPAGSGKTELLIQRFLTLLNKVNSPEEILAITFTKKAANEMRTRIIKSLKSATIDTQPESPHARLTWKIARDVLERDKHYNWNLLANPNQLRIQTIDSVCAYLTKQLPLLSHFGSPPSLADNPFSLYREAVREVLTHLEQDVPWSDSIKQLLSHLDNDLNKLHNLLINLLAKRDQWLTHIHTDQDNYLRHTLETHLQQVVSEALQQIKHLLPSEHIPELLAIANFAASQTQQAYLSDIPSTHPHDKTLWMRLASLLLTKSFTWRKRVDEEIGFPSLTSLKNPEEKALHTTYRKRHQELVVALSENEPLRLSLMQLSFLPTTHYSETQWEILQNLIQLLKIVTAQLRLTFQQHGMIDFIENAQGALLALGEHDAPTDLALLLDYQIKHILVDEFQDTSFSQYQLLEKLTLGWEAQDGRTLFVVGDPMQSIYRFREAEVGIFIKMCQYGIGNVKLIPLTLAVNFRSYPEIVEWNNAIFTNTFPQLNDIATGAVKYSKSTSLQTKQSANDAAISLHGFVNGEDNDQAKHIVCLIQETLSNYPNEKIAVLVRSRSHLAALIPALKQAQIDYSAIDIDPLAKRQSIQDLLSLTLALLNPVDRIAWLAILRAPWCGLRLEDLLIIAGPDARTTIWQQLQSDNIIHKLSADGSARLRRIIPILKRKIAERDRLDLRKWVESTWLLLGGPACLEDKHSLLDAKAFFNLLSDFSSTNAHINSQNLIEKIDCLFATTQHANANLQLMTMHAAKGLEFDTVILPHLEKKMPVDDKSLLLWMERPINENENALLLAPIHATGSEQDNIYNYIHKQQQNKLIYETDRLLYVATTRAKKRLHIFFNLKQNEKGEYRHESSSFLAKLWPHIETQTNLITLPSTDSNVQVSKPKYIKRLHTEWQNPISDTSSNTTIHQKKDGFKLSNNKPKFIGTVIHRTLQQISLQGLTWWKTSTPASQLTYLTRQFKQIGLPLADFSSSLSLAHDIIQKATADEKGQWILTPHTEAKSEFALTRAVEDRIENLIVDRTFIDETGTRWIIDYKTTSFNEEDVDLFLTHEQAKYREKMQSYLDAMKAIDPRPIRLGLYFPALPAWKEW